MTSENHPLVVLRNSLWELKDVDEEGLEKSLDVLEGAVHHKHVVIRSTAIFILSRLYTRFHSGRVMTLIRSSLDELDPFVALEIEQCLEYMADCTPEHNTTKAQEPKPRSVRRTVAKDDDFEPFDDCDI